MVESRYGHVSAWRTDSHRLQHDGANAIWPGDRRTVRVRALSIYLCLDWSVRLLGQREIWQLFAGSERRFTGPGWRNAGDHHEARRHADARPSFEVDQLRRHSIRHWIHGNGNR